MKDVLFSLLVCALLAAGCTATEPQDVILMVSNYREDTALLYRPQAGCTQQQDNYGYTPDKPPATCSCNGQLYISSGQALTIDEGIGRWHNLDVTNKTTRTLPNLLLGDLYKHSMDCVNNGTQLLICGGGYLALSACQMCDVSLSTPVCVSVSDMPAPRSVHTSVTVNDTQVLIIGGWYQLSTAVNTIYSYDTRTDLWQTLPSMNEARGFYPGAAMLDANRLLVCGGYGSNETTLSSCEMLSLNDLAQGWRRVSPMLQARSAFGLVPMGDGFIYALGGRSDGEYFASVEVFNTTSLSWQHAKYNLTQAMDTDAAARLRSSIIGGIP